MIPFDIQMVGKNGFRIRPYSLEGKFLVMYECMIEVWKVIVPANATQRIGNL